MQLVFLFCKSKNNHHLSLLFFIILMIVVYKANSYKAIMSKLNKIYIRNNDSNIINNETSKTNTNKPSCSHIENCIKTSSNCQCLKCKDNYTMSKDLFFCFKNKKHCLKLDTQTGMCNKCENDDYFFISKTTGECIRLISNCSFYDEIKGSCLKCKIGFYPQGEYSCLNYITGCYQYRSVEVIKTLSNHSNRDLYIESSNNNTTTSIRGTKVNNHIITNINSNRGQENNKEEETELQCDKCSDGFIISSNKKMCYEIVPNCTDFSNDYGICNKCEADFFLSNSKTRCYRDIDNCIKRNYVFGVCDECSETSILSNSRQECFGKKAFCISVNLDSGLCEKCVNNENSNYHLYNGHCYLDVVGCREYTDACIECEKEYFLLSRFNICVSNDSKVDGCVEYDKNKMYDFIECSECFKEYSLVRERREYNKRKDDEDDEMNKTKCVK